MQKGTLLGKKVIAYDTIAIRTARSGDFAPLIIPVPKVIADAISLKKGDKMTIYTDGDRIYLDRFKEPEI